jgi:hypothetical protein
MTYIDILVMLLMGHYIFDWVLQKEFLSLAKNPDSGMKEVPWYQAMTAHCYLHAGTVYLITHRFEFFIVEFVVHFITDYCKCKKYISMNTDQLIHICCKLLYFVLCWISTSDYVVTISLR